jgi:hypothetical protein
LRQREHALDQPAPRFGFASEAFSSAPLGNVEWLAGFAVYPGRCGKQGLDIEAFGYGIGSIPFFRLIHRHGDPPHLRTDAAQFGDYRIGVFSARRIVIGPDRDDFACQRRPVGFIDGRGRATHCGSGDDADTHQGIGAFFTFDQHDRIDGADRWQVVERSRFRHTHRTRPDIPRSVLLAIR